MVTLSLLLNTNLDLEKDACIRNFLIIVGSL